MVGRSVLASRSLKSQGAARRCSMVKRRENSRAARYVVQTAHPIKPGSA